MIEFPLIHAFGLGSLLTEEDDPALWEAALGLHWSPPVDPNCMVEALRFDIGRQLKTGEQPVGEQNELHAKMRGLVDIEEWCFERMDERQLRVKPCPSSAPPVSVLPGLESFRADVRFWLLQFYHSNPGDIYLSGYFSSQSRG